MVYHQDDSFKLDGLTAGLMLCKVSGNLIGLKCECKLSSSSDKPHNECVVDKAHSQT